MVNFFWSPSPAKRSAKIPRKIRGKFGAKSGAKFGTKIRRIRETFVLQLLWPKAFKELIALENVLLNCCSCCLGVGWSVCERFWQHFGQHLVGVWIGGLGCCSEPKHLLGNAGSSAKRAIRSGPKIEPKHFFSNFSGASGISRDFAGISRQKSLIPWVSRDIPNFLAPTPSRGRPPPHQKISGLKSLGLGSFFVPEFGNEKTMTARDVTRFCAFSLYQIAQKTWRKGKHHWRKKISGDGAPKLQMNLSLVVVERILSDFTKFQQGPTNEHKHFLLYPNVF